MNKSDGLPASVQARLQNHAKATNQDYNRILERYALERYLYRLSKSKHADRFVLKGALMMLVWLGETIRPTRDADLLGFGDLDNKSLLNLFQDVCKTQADPDGMTFQPDTLEVEDIRENDPYGGRRASFIGMRGKARISLQVDVGLGDAVTPEPEWLDYPSLLDMPKAHLRAYRPETAIAEKFHAMVMLGLGNSRMKDFFDIAALAHHDMFDGATLAAAIKATFERRRIEVPKELPVALTSTFATDQSKQSQWKAFTERNKIANAITLDATVASVREFIAPLIAAQNMGTAFTKTWPPSGPWK